MTTGSCPERKADCLLVPASRSTKMGQAVTRDQASLHPDLDALRAAGRRRKGLLRDFEERVCTSYSGLMSLKANSYRNRLNALLAVSQLKSEYVRAYRI